MAWAERERAVLLSRRAWWAHAPPSPSRSPKTSAVGVPVTAILALVLPISLNTALPSFKKTRAGPASLVDSPPSATTASRSAHARRVGWARDTHAQ